jgi:hypothetical protein
MIVFDAGDTAMSKFPEAGKTLILRRGGLASELFAASTTVNDATYSPAEENVTFPGVCSVDVAGEPPGNIHEYFAAVLVVANDTEPPAVIVTSDTGELIVPAGGAAVTVSKSTNRAFEGTPSLSTRNSM